MQVEEQGFITMKLLMHGDITRQSWQTKSLGFKQWIIKALH